MATIRFNVDPMVDGKICVKQLINEDDKGDNVVVVKTNDDGSIQSVTKEPAATAPAAAASEASAAAPVAGPDGVTVAGPDGVTDGVTVAGPPAEGGEDGEGETKIGGFSMKSLSRGLFGTKKRFNRKSIQKKRSIRRNRSTRRTFRRKSKRTGKRR